MKEALFWESVEKNKVKCQLCPHNCIIAPGKRGFCRVRINDGGVLFNESYGAVTSCHPDPIEKKPLYHFKPGSLIYSIGTYGCNLACDFCQNYEISQAESPYFKTYTPEEIVENAHSSDSIGIAYTYSEPITWYEFVLDTSKLNKEMNVLVTNGYINKDPLDELAQHIDAANVDIKGGKEFYNKLCHSPYKDIFDTVRTLYQKKVHVEVTNLIIPGHNDSTEELKALCKELNDISSDIPLHFSRFFPCYKMASTPPTPLDTLEKAYAIAKDVGVKYVYLGNVGGIGGDTICPNCGHKIIERDGFSVGFNTLDRGNCRNCGEKIYGRW